MDLLIDIGNTRIKWATMEGRQLTLQHAAPYADWESSHIHGHILNELVKPQRVLIANVGGEAIGTLIATCIKAAWDLAPEFVFSTASLAHVRNGYRIPEQLGVDRWLAVIGAYYLEHRISCVVNVGTAMTVDGVEATGQHLGGIIVPGPELLISSLYQNTSDIAVRANNGTVGTDFFADNTQAAVHQGATHALSAVVEHACQNIYARFGEMPALFITGGASSRITNALRIPFRLVPDLVLRGLVEVAHVPKI